MSIRYDAHFGTDTDAFRHWTAIQEHDPGRVHMVTSPTHGESQAAHFENRPGDNNVAGSGSGERCELYVASSLLGAGWGVAGSKQVTGLAVRFDAGFPYSSNLWNAFAQWHAAAGGTQASTLAIVNGQLMCVTNGGALLTDKPFNRAVVDPDWDVSLYYEIIVEKFWGADARAYFDVTFNKGGGPIGPVRVAGPNIYTPDPGRPYPKIGSYRAPGFVVSSVLEYGRYIEADTYAEIAAIFGWGGASPPPPPVDSTSPVLDHAAVSGNVLTATFSESLDESSVPSVTDWDVEVGGSPITVATVRVSGANVVLILDAPVPAAAHDVTLGYTLGSPPLQDLASNDVASFTDAPVEVTSPSGTGGSAGSGGVGGGGFTSGGEDAGPCCLFAAEVFADDDGSYVGDFAYGDGPGGPFGWVACMAGCDPLSWFACFRSFTRDYPCGCDLPYVGMHVPFANGAGKAYTVADSSGPPGLEALPAMRVDLPGAPDVFVGWVGSQVIDPATGAWRTGTLDGDTGWQPVDGELWCFQCWAKVVPDKNDVEVEGARLAFAVAPEGFSAGSPTSDALDLTTEWQFYQTFFSGPFFPSGPWNWPLIAFSGDIENVQPDFCTFFNDRIDIVTYHPLGSVLIKCAHLYKPAGGAGGNWIDNFHGGGRA